MKNTLRGAVIIDNEIEAQGLIQLLTYHARQHLELLYFSHPYDIPDPEFYDFVLLVSVEMLASVVRLYDGRRYRLPLIVHLGTPHTLEGVDHSRLFPGVGVLPIQQAEFTMEPDITLELNLLGKIQERLGHI